jgi:hypothetical protein
MQRDIAKQCRPRNRQELVAQIQHAWGRISDRNVKALTDSFENRLQACIANNGETTKY